LHKHYQTVNFYKATKQNNLSKEVKINMAIPSKDIEVRRESIDKLSQGKIVKAHHS
jgi:hypothetical protein